MDLLIEYMITRGGVWGFLLALAVLWIFWRETNFFKNKSVKKEEEEGDSLKEIVNTHSKEIKYSQQKSAETLQEIAATIESFKKINHENSERIVQLTEQLQQVNDNRVDELKNILQE
jgi:uncharacterized membrane protein YhiD involved in acid resistance